MNGLKISVLMALFAILIVPSVVAANLEENLEIEQFEINDIEVDFFEDTEIDEEFERGEELEILMKVVPTLEDVEDLEIAVFIAGDKYVEQRRDLTYDFDTYRGTLDKDNAKTFRLSLTIPEDLDLDKISGDDYKLRVMIADANSPGMFTQDFQLTIEGVDDEKSIRIDDFAFSPRNVVVGRAFTALVRVENLGDEEIDDLKVTVSVPALGIEDTQYMDSDDELDTDDTQTFEELLLRIPMDAEPGTYDVEVYVEFDKYYDAIERGTIKVVEEKSASAAEDTSYVTATPSQEFSAGSSAIYPILIENADKNAKTYAITVTGLSEWAEYSIEPSSVVNVAGESKDTVLLTVTAKEDATAGEKAFVVSVDTPTNTIQKALTATITEGNGSGTPWQNVQNGLTIGLIILVIILIILGLIIGFSKLKGSGEKDDETQTYY